jgi:uncharacterized protein involved in response to NO
MATSAKQMRAWQGPALFSFGFRPFFLGATVWVVVAMLMWILMLAGSVELPTRFDPAAWHAHEFLFGYLGAVLAGFLLTAVPNWTGRFPMVGWPLAALFALWCAGRIAILTAAMWPAGVAAGLDIAFPVVLGALILREIIAGRNWRNLAVLALLGGFTCANALFHFEAMGGAYAPKGFGLRLGLATVVMMIGVIGGRIVPSFTRNWLAQNSDAARPAPPMQRFDRIVLLASLGILSVWVALPTHVATGILLLVLALLHTARLLRWQGHHTYSEALVFVLHAAYALIPLGALALGMDVLLGQANQAAAQHVWMAGTIGAMTLAVMTRATRGHTGQTLVADKPTILIYLSVFGSVGLRYLAPSEPALITVSGILWIAAFGGFLLAYGPSLCGPAKVRQI